MPVTNASFRNWLKRGSNMKLSSDAAVVRITHEGITDFRSFLDFDKESIEIGDSFVGNSHNCCV